MHAVGRGDVELYIRTYNTLLLSSGGIRVKALEEVHLNTNSILHPNGRDVAPDMSALIYSVWRLPSCMADVVHVVMGQSPAAFERSGLGDVESWRAVSAPGRRRHWRYDDGQQRLAVYIGSSSDVDDVVPCVTAYQIEWNKLHALLVADPETLQMVGDMAMNSKPPEPESANLVRERLLMGEADWHRLARIWGDRFLADPAGHRAGAQEYDIASAGGLARRLCSGSADVVGAHCRRDTQSRSCRPPGVFRV